MIRTLSICSLLWSLHAGDANSQSGRTPPVVRLDFWRNSGRVLLTIENIPTPLIQLSVVLPPDQMRIPAFPLIADADQEFWSPHLLHYRRVPEGRYDLGYRAIALPINKIEVYFEVSFFGEGFGEVREATLPEPPMFMIPEPSSLSIAIASGVGLCALRHRRHI